MTNRISYCAAMNPPLYVVCKSFKGVKLREKFLLVLNFHIIHIKCSRAVTVCICSTCNMTPPKLRIVLWVIFRLILMVTNVFI